VEQQGYSHSGLATHGVNAFMRPKFFCKNRENLEITAHTFPGTLEEESHNKDLERGH
jgi:hypothetical protein